MRRKTFLMMLLATATLLLFGDVAMAAENDRSMFKLFVWPGGGPVSVLLIVVDVVSWAFIIQYVITVRRINIMPDPVREQIRAMFDLKQYRQAIEFTAFEPSMLSHIIHASLNEAAHGYASMERALDEATEARTAKLVRKIEVLNVLGNIGPMVGLLGTVLGIVMAFNDIVSMGGIPEPAYLADSIGVALVATFWGLMVAIPALVVYALLRNRIEGLAAETALTAEELISAFRPSVKKV